MSWEKWFVRLQVGLLLACLLMAVAWGPRQLVHTVLGTGLPAAGETVPRQIPYRGYLERDGAPLNDPALAMRFRLYGIDGGMLFEESRSGVPVQEGQFAIELGDATPIPPAVLQSNFLELEIAVGTPAVALSGRQRLLTVPYAARADSALHGVPAGTIVAFGGTAVPEGWLPCDGRAVSQSQFPALAAALVNAWGDGSTTTLSGGATGAGYFNLPDLRGRFLRGVNDSATGGGRDPGDGRIGSAAGGNAGNAVGSLQLSEFRAHNHGSAGSHVHVTGENQGTDLNGWGRASAHGFNFQSYAGTTQANLTSPSGSHVHATEGGTETRPANVYVSYIIKY